MCSLEQFTEAKPRTDRNLMVQPSSTQTTSLHPGKLNLCISCGTAGLGASPMETVFRTPLARQTGWRSSWPVHNPRRTEQQQRLVQGEAVQIPPLLKFYPP